MHVTCVYFQHLYNTYKYNAPLFTLEIDHIKQNYEKGHYKGPVGRFIDIKIRFS